MASVSTYLNFPGTCDHAFQFYKKVFRSEFLGAITRMCDVPSDPNYPPIPKEALNLICNITLHPESREETNRLFTELSEGGKVEMPLQDMFWGDYYGTLTDKFGTLWMFNFAKAQ